MVYYLGSRILSSERILPLGIGNISRRKHHSLKEQRVGVDQSCLLSRQTPTSILLTRQEILLGICMLEGPIAYLPLLVLLSSDPTNYLPTHLPQHPTKMPRNYASLADQSVFPSISDLPGDYTCPETGGGVFGCLLVEIVSIERITRLVLRTFDRADSPVTVAFYTGDRGRSIENDPKLKAGNTMAILFPRRHLFLDGTVGVRQEHYGYFKV